MIESHEENMLTNNHRGFLYEFYEFLSAFSVISYQADGRSAWASVPTLAAGSRICNSLGSVAVA